MLQWKMQRCGTTGWDMFVNILKSFDHEFCEGCVKGKAASTTPKPIGEIKTTRPLELVHIDVCEPCHVSTANGKRYVITFTDDYTRRAHTYFLARESEALGVFKEYHTSVVGETGEQIGRLRSDKGGEYLSKEFKEYLCAHKIHQERVRDPQAEWRFGAP